jgi:hypothetical protein
MANVEPTTMRVTDIMDGTNGVIVDWNDSGRVKVLIGGTKVRYYARKDVASRLKRRTSRISNR